MVRGSGMPRRALRREGWEWERMEHLMILLL